MDYEPVSAKPVANKFTEHGFECKKLAENPYYLISRIAQSRNMLNVLIVGESHSGRISLVNTIKRVLSPSYKSSHKCKHIPAEKGKFILNAVRVTNNVNILYCNDLNPFERNHEYSLNQVLKGIQINTEYDIGKEIDHEFYTRTCAVDLVVIAYDISKKLSKITAKSSESEILSTLQNIHLKHTSRISHKFLLSIASKLRTKFLPLVVMNHSDVCPKLLYMNRIREIAMPELPDTCKWLITNATEDGLYRSISTFLTTLNLITTYVIRKDVLVDDYIKLQNQKKKTRKRKRTTS